MFLAIMFMMSFSSFQKQDSQITHDYFVFGGTEKKIQASKNEEILFEKIYLSRKPLEKSVGCPPAPRFFYYSKKYQKSFAVFSSMMWIDHDCEPEENDKTRESIWYFRVDRSAVDEFMKHTKKYR